MLTVSGWGTAFFADDIVLLASSAQELLSMLDVAAGFARWHLRFNPKKCGVLIVGQKKQEKKGWRLGNDRIGEVDEYKYWGYG